MHDQKAGPNTRVEPATVPPSENAEDRSVRTRQIWLTAGILILALWVSVPFLTPIIWATILGVAEWPLHRRAMARFPRRPMVVSLCLTVATALLVILPLSIGAVALAQESQGALDWLKHAQQFGIAVPSWLSGLPLVGAKLSGWWSAHLASPQGANALLGTVSAGSVLGLTRSIGGEIAKDSALFLVTLVVLATLLIAVPGSSSIRDRWPERCLAHSARSSSCEWRAPSEQP